MSNNDTTRRHYLKTLTTTAIGAGAVSNIDSVAAQTDTAVVFEQDFESLSAGTYPSEWTKDGNDSQQVVNTDAASGSKCLEQRGSFGGCWQALANAPVDFPASYSVRISGAVKPLSEGSYGCHDKFRCKLQIRTDVGSWSTGKGYTLLNFQPDGTVRGRTGDGTTLGTYTTDEWTRFEVGYRPRDSGIEFTFRINGEKSDPFVVDAAGFEEQLSYLKFVSGDFVTRWDNISVTRLPVEVSPLERQSDDSAGDDSAIPVLNRFSDDSETVGVGLLAMLGVGGYAAYRRRDRDQRPPAQPQTQRGTDTDERYDRTAGQSGQTVQNPDANTHHRTDSDGESSHDTES